MRLLPRIVSGGIPSLDGLRALSIACVVVTHAELGLPISGSIGVTVFFFISGFLITTLLRRELDKTGKISLWRFYTRRSLRIFPPLYLVLVVAVLLTAVGFIHSSMSPGGVAAGATFTANYFIIFGDRDSLPGGMGILWSLAVEEHYYLLFPALFLAMAKWLPSRQRQTAVLVAVCVVVLAWRCWLRWHGASDVRLYYATDTRLDSILWGAVLAIAANPVYGQAPRWLTHPKLATPIAVSAGLAVWAVDRLTSATVQYTAGYTMQSLALFAGVTAVVAAPRSLAGRLLNTRLAVYIGVVSYTIYLVHRPALTIAQQARSNESFWVAVALAATLLICEAIRRFVEEPIRSLRSRLHQHDEKVAQEDGEAILSTPEVNTP